MSNSKDAEKELEEIRKAEDFQKREEAVLQRQNQRLRMEAKITLRSQTNFFMGFSENISEGGIFIATECPPAVGDIVEVDIPMVDGSTTITIKGIVRWYRMMADGEPSGCGVQFTDLPPGADKHLENMISLLQKEPLFIDL